MILKMKEYKKKYHRLFRKSGLSCILMINVFALSIVALLSY